MPGARQQARGAHRPLAVAAHHHRRHVRHRLGSFGEVCRARHAGHRGRARRRTRCPVGCRGPARRRGRRASTRRMDEVGSPGGGPGVDAPGELADDVVVADLAGLPERPRRVLVRLAHDDQRADRRRPASRARWRRPGRSGIDTAPGTWRGANAVTGRASTTSAPRARSRRDRRRPSAARAGHPPASGGARGGWSPPAGGSTAGSCRASPAAAGRRCPRPRRASSGFVARSVPIVEVRSAPGGAEQNEPAPCVGHTATSSASSASRAATGTGRGRAPRSGPGHQVGPRRRPDDQGPAGEDPHHATGRPAAGSDMLVVWPGRGHRAQP